MAPLNGGNGDAPCPEVSRLQMQRERHRERELAKYFRSADIVPVDIDNERATASGARRSKDATLTALAQLGALKLQCERSFISIIDATHVYVIGEATRTHALQKDAAASVDDSLYLGVRALELHWGVCPTTIQHFTGFRPNISTHNVTADKNRYTIRDFTLEATHRDRPYITGWPHMRSYAEVPLRTEEGSVIGSYCVVDTKPRSFSSQDLESLAEISSSIMSHLDLLRIKQDHKRAQQLIHGLGSFVRSSLDPASLESSNLSTGQRGTIGACSDSDGRVEDSITSAEDEATSSFGARPADIPLVSSNDDTAGVGRLLSHLELDTGAELETLPGANTEPNLEQSGTHEETPVYCDPPIPVADEQPYSSETKEALPDEGDVFNNVANLACKSNDVDGVLILDSEVDSVLHPVNGLCSPGVLYDTIGTDHLSAQAMCKVLGSASTSRSAISGETHHERPRCMPASIIKHVLDKNPAGAILTREEDAPLLDQYLKTSPDNAMPASAIAESYSEQDFLFESLGNPLSIVLAPMWGANHRKWSLCMVCWTSDRSRTFDSDDISLLSALNNSIVADIARKDAISTIQTKNDFLSTISHELRSPLHGILASVELLEEIHTDTESRSFLTNIKNCGTTLMDTMDQLLAFTEYNGLDKAEEQKILDQAVDEAIAPIKVVSKSESTSIMAPANLATLVEEVLVSVELGHAYKEAHNHAMANERRGSTAGLSNDDSTPVTTLLTIDPRAARSVHAQIGALRRIVMILCSNALRFTSRGHVEIDLCIVNDGSDFQEQALQLTVRDSGRGIAPEYQKTRLFDPFSQEDPVSEGTGLGLNIARRLVWEHKGTLDVRSELQVGTVMEATIPFNGNLIEHPEGDEVYLPRDLVGRFKGLSAHVPECLSLPDGLLLHAPLSIHDSTVRVLARSLHVTLEQSLGMDVVTEGPADVWITSERGELLVSASEQSIECAGVAIKAPISPKAILAALAHVLNFYSDLDDATRHILRNFAPGHISQLAPSHASQAMPITPRTTSPSSHDVQHPREETPDRSQALASPEKKPMNFLLVDDNPVNLKVLGTCISRLGYAHTYANDGQAAVDEFSARSSGPYTVVFMDLSMPVMDGFDATKRIRKLEDDNGWPRTKIIAISAFGTEESKARAKQCGCDMFLAKPVSMRKIKELLGSWEKEAVDGMLDWDTAQ